VKFHPSSIVKNFAMISLSGLAISCSCINSRFVDLDKMDYSLYYPDELVVYRPTAGSPPNKDRLYGYLAFQNESKTDEAFCFGRWSPRKQEWRKSLFGIASLAPRVKLLENTAPIVGDPVFHLTGISRETVLTGKRFPEVGPDSDDFPYNEYNFDRAFAIEMTPDRSKPPGSSGYLRFAFDLADISDSKSESQEVEVRILVSVSGEFRPGQMTVTQSQKT
jgi:hypothetical protein